MYYYSYYQDIIFHSINSLAYPSWCFIDAERIDNFLFVIDQIEVNDHAIITATTNNNNKR